MTTDEYLLQQALKFDPDALRTLHHRYYEPVYRFALLKVGHVHLAEDITGEIFLRVLEALKKGRGWTTSPAAWIFGIARNVIVDHYRSKGRRPEDELAEDLASAPGDSPVQRYLHGERRRQLEQALTRLTPEQRDVVLLRFMEGFSVAEVAETLKKSPGAVKALQHRALNVLAELLKDNEFRNDDERS